MGEALKKLAWPRLKYVVSTKFFWGITDGPNEKNTLNRKYLMQAIDGSPQAPAARLRGPRLLPPPRSRDAHRGDGLGDARHDPAGQGALLGHLRVERLRDHGRLADRRAPPPAPSPWSSSPSTTSSTASAWRASTATSTTTSAWASRPGARSPRACSPASTATACPRTAAAPSRAWPSSWRSSPTRRTRVVGALEVDREGAGLHARAARDRLVRQEPPRLHRDHRRLARGAGAART